MLGSKMRQLNLQLMLEGMWLVFLENPCQVTLIKDFPGLESSTLTLPARAKHSTLTLPLYQALVLWLLGYTEDIEADFIPQSGTLEGVHRNEKRSRELQVVADNLLLGSRVLMQLQSQKFKTAEENGYLEQKMHERLRKSYTQFLNRRIRKIMDMNFLNDNIIKQANVMSEERVLVQLLAELYQSWHQHFLDTSSLEDLLENEVS